MTASRQQCAQANVFLTVYKDAVQTLKQSAQNKTDWEKYFDFRDKFISVKQQKKPAQFKQLIQNEPLKALNSKIIDTNVYKNIEYMKFNYYLFLKYLPSYIQFKGKPAQLIDMMKKGNLNLKKSLQQLRKTQKSIKQ